MCPDEKIFHPEIKKKIRINGRDGLPTAMTLAIRMAIRQYMFPKSL
tara:strand:+ start:242 stop:379 length:138 start_codon:yes stop_codon:yes gene_type:complete